MKKFLMSAFAIAMLTGVGSNAMAQKGFNLSVKATPQFSFIQNSDDNDDSNIKRNATFNTNFGIGAGYNFNGNMGVGADVLYSLQGQKYEVSGADLEQKLEYVKVPVFFSYNTDASKTTSFYGKIGPQVSFLTNAKITAPDGNDAFLENKNRYEDVTFGAMANAGVQFKLSPNIFLQTGLNFDYDFSNIENKNFPVVIAGRANSYNMTAGVQIGLKYQF